MFLSVIIPCYNEEKRLPDTLQKVRKYLSTQNYDPASPNASQGGWEVLIVNDGSTDSTPRVASGLVKNWKGFRIIDNKENQGKGAVVRQGMLAAKGDWRLFMDADNSTDISEVEKLFNFINPKQINTRNVIPGLTRDPGLDSRWSLSRARTRGGNDKGNCYEIIIGSRYLDKGSIKVKQPLVRRIVSRLGNVLVRTLLGIKSVDTQCGFKLMSALAVEQIFPLQQIKRWGFDMEILAIAIKKGYKIKEVAVDWYDAEGSSVKKSAAIKTLRELFQIKWNVVRGKYR